MPNPFDLHGPPFLLFYAVLAALTVTLAAWRRRSSESGPAARPLRDYLEIAFLRGGPAEAVRVAVLSLVDRELLRVVGDRVERVRRDGARRAARATERAILQATQTPRSTATLAADRAVTRAATRECEPALIREGLLPDERQRARRGRAFALAVAVLLGVAAIKIALAFARGRTNVIFLMLEALAFVVLARAATHPRRTPAGRALIQDLHALFAGLKVRAGALRPHTGGNDLALLAAVYGVSAALPAHPDARALFPRADRASSGSAGGACGSSCGSSCGGGGGGGGGCGGCGS